MKSIGKKYLFFCVLFLGTLIAVNVFGQEHSHKWYNSKGKKSKFKKMIKACQDADIVLFGEQHNSAISHWVQLELLKSMNGTRSLVLGAEMLESDNQKELNDFLNGKIDYEAFDSLARLWPNFKTDYAPLVGFAKEHQLTFVADNVPRRYAKMIYYNGFEALDSLPDNEKSYIAPLPIKYDASLPGYAEMKAMMGGHGGDNLPKSQAIKDAAMAHFIFDNWKKGTLFIHFNGAYHSNNYEGIYWYLKLLNPDLKIVTISTEIQKNINKLNPDSKGLADFIIVVDEDVTTTY